MADWTALHEDVLLLVVLLLPALDLLRFRAVCKPWRAAAAGFVARFGRPCPDRPWLLLPTEVPVEHDLGRISPCRDREVPVVTLPARLGRVNPRRFVPLGSGRGVVVAADERGKMHLLDLVTGARKHLLRVATLPLVARVQKAPAGLLVHRCGGGVGTINDLILKAVPVPVSGGGVLVVVIYRQQHPHNQWATARLGDSAWKSVAPTSIPAVVDVVVHKGQLYANTRYGIMYVFPELHGLVSASPEIIPSVTRHSRAYVERSFLVECPRDELMQVELLRPVVAAGGEGFVVRVLDECSEAWEETEHIGDAAVLVDASGAVAASTSECPALRPNTVYYAVDLAGETRVWAYSLTGKHKRIEVVEESRSWRSSRRRKEDMAQLDGDMQKKIYDIIAKGQAYRDSKKGIIHPSGPTDPGVEITMNSKQDCEKAYWPLTDEEWKKSEEAYAAEMKEREDWYKAHLKQVYYEDESDLECSSSE